MDKNRTAVERAFEMARSGQFSTVTEIKAAISREGYSVGQIEGPSLMKQLRLAARAASQSYDQSPP